MRPLAALALLAGLAGCTSTEVQIPTEHGLAIIKSSRVFSSTALSLNDSGFNYSSDPQAQAAADLLKQGLQLGLALGAKGAAAGGASWHPGAAPLSSLDVALPAKLEAPEPRS